MKLYVNDALTDSSALEHGTLGEALRDIQKNVADRGHVVVGFERDGRQMAGADVEHAMGESISDCDRLEVYTALPAQLVSEAMTQAEASLSEVAARIGEVADHLAKGQASDGIALLGGCVNDWQQIHAAITKSIQMLGFREDQIEVDDIPLASMIAKPKEVLTQIVAALQAQDYVLLADVLQYEFSEAEDIWQRVIARVRALAEDAS